MARADIKVIESLDAQTVTAFVPICVVCGKPAVVRNIPAQAFAAWYSDDAAVQDALPMLSAGDREILATGTHGECFDSLCDEAEAL